MYVTWLTYGSARARCGTGRGPSSTRCTASRIANPRQPWAAAMLHLSTRPHRATRTSILTTSWGRLSNHLGWMRRLLDRAPGASSDRQLLLVVSLSTTSILHQTQQHMLLRGLFSAQVSAAQLPWTLLRGRLLLYNRHHTTWASISAHRRQLLLVAVNHSTSTILHQTSQHMLLRELDSAQVSAARLPQTLPRERLLLYDRHHTTWAPIVAAPRYQL